MEFGVSVRDLEPGDGLVVEASGELDISTAPTLRATLEEVVDKVVAGDPPHLQVDLRQVDFMDSTGLGVLVGARHALRDRPGAFSVVCTNKRLLTLFKITGLDEAIVITDRLLTAQDAR